MITQVRVLQVEEITQVRVLQVEEIIQRYI